MSRAQALSLAHVTVLHLPPPDLVRLAARLGLPYVGLRLIAATATEPAHPMLGDTPTRRATLGALADTGLKVLDVEVVRLFADTDIANFEAMLETAARLGAAHVVVTGNDADRGRLTANFAAFCGLARDYGLTANLEFMSFTQVPDLKAALDILQQANQPNSGVLVDCLHFDRSRAGAAALARIPRHWLHYAQLCDAPADWIDDEPSLIATARTARLAPGEGGIEIAGFVGALPSGLPFSLEVPSAQAGHDAQAWAARIVAAARQLFGDD